MNTTIKMLSAVLDSTALRQNVLANNIANVNTPNFKRLDVEFKNALNAALQSDQPGALDNFRPTIIKDKSALSRGDGNTVSLQKEVGEMAENALLYNFATKAITKKLASIRKAIGGQ